MRAAGRRLLPGLLLLAAAAVGAEENRFALGFFSRGAALRYSWPGPYFADLRFQGDGVAQALGARAGRSFGRGKRLSFFASTEVHRVWFEGDDSRGTGHAWGIPLGAAYKLSRTFSAQLELGPSFVSLEDDDTGAKSSGTDLVVDVGVYWHWGGR